VVAARRRWTSAVAVSLMLLIVADTARVYGLVFGTPTWLASRWSVASETATLSIIGSGMAIAGLALLRMRRRLEAAAAATVAGGVLAVTGGLLELDDLRAAHLASALPDGAARVVIAIALGGGVGLVVASLLELRRGSPIRVRPAPRSDSGPIPADDTRTASRSDPASG